MSRYIDADRLKETLRQGCFSSVMKVIDREPTADVQEVKHGKWIYGNYKDKAKCSNCERLVLIATYPTCFPNYCPCCGAKMDEVKE